MTICTRCRRNLLHPVMTAAGPMGEKCARASFGAKPRRIKREQRKSADERQVELFQGATQ